MRSGKEFARRVSRRTPTFDILNCIVRSNHSITRQETGRSPTTAQNLQYSPCDGIVSPGSHWEHLPMCGICKPFLPPLSSIGHEFASVLTCFRRSQKWQSARKRNTSYLDRFDRLHRSFSPRLHGKIAGWEEKHALAHERGGTSKTHKSQAR